MPVAVALVGVLAAATAIAFEGQYQLIGEQGVVENPEMSYEYKYNPASDPVLEPRHVDVRMEPVFEQEVSTAFEAYFKTADGQAYSPRQGDPTDPWFDCPTGSKFDTACFSQCLSYANFRIEENWGSASKNCKATLYTFVYSCQLKASGEYKCTCGAPSMQKYGCSEGSGAVKA